MLCDYTVLSNNNIASTLKSTPNSTSRECSGVSIQILGKQKFT